MAVAVLTFLLAILSLGQPAPTRSRRAGFTVAVAQAKPKPASTREVFETNCARCHGADGGGDTPLGQTYKSPDFTDGEWWKKNSEITNTRSLISIVTNGKGGMPAFGKKLKTAEIKSLVSYVRRFRK